MIQLERCMRSFDKSDTRFLAFLDSLLDKIEKQGLSWIQARQAANIVYTIGKMKLINPSTQRILRWISRQDIANQFVEEAIEMEKPQGVANTVWAFATLQVEASQLLATIEARSDWLVKNGTPQNASNIVWAFAKLKTEAPKLLTAIGDRSNWLVENGNTQDLANTAWAFAALNTEAPKLFSAIEDRSDWLVENGNTQEVANTVWAFAVLQTEAPKLLSSIEARSDWLVENGSPQGVANIARAFATLRSEAPKLLSAIEARSDWLVENGTPQGVPNTVWAFAVLQTEAPKLLSSIEARSDWLVANGSPQGVANITWAFATLKSEAPRLLSAIEARSDWLVENGLPQHLASTVWAFATLKTEAPNLLSAIEARFHWLVKNGSPQGVANTAWAFATLKTEASKLFSAIEARSNRLVQNGTPQNVANTAWAFATIGFEGTPFFDALDHSQGTVLGKELYPQSVANLCFAIAIAGRVIESEVFLLQLWDKAVEFFEAGVAFRDEEFLQLSQTQIFANSWGVELSACPLSMALTMEEAMMTKNADGNQVSRSSKKVSKILKDIGFDHECEVPPDSNIVGSMMAIDFACTKRKVAIEYDCEGHFLKAHGSGELTFKQDGRTQAKRRLLKQLGWTVINLDFRDYIEARRNSNEQAWLRAELKQAGVLLP